MDKSTLEYLQRHPALDAAIEFLVDYYKRTLSAGGHGEPGVSVIVKGDKTPDSFRDPAGIVYKI